MEHAQSPQSLTEVVEVLFSSDSPFALLDLPFGAFVTTDRLLFAFIAVFVTLANAVTASALTPELFCSFFNKASAVLAFLTR